MLILKQLGAMCMEAVLQRCRVLSSVIMPVPPCPNYLGKTLISKGLSMLGKCLGQPFKNSLFLKLLFL